MRTEDTVMGGLTGHARLATWDFQAPDFYRGQGYGLVGEVPDHPPGVTEYIFAKRLGRASGSGLRETPRGR